jgi:hypothetical protein
VLAACGALELEVSDVIVFEDRTPTDTMGRAVALQLPVNET